MPCRPTVRRWLHSASSSPSSGKDRSGAAVRKTARLGSRSRSSPKIGSRNRISFIHGQEYASPSPTHGGSRMRESRTYGSVRGALRNERPYRDRCARNDGWIDRAHPSGKRRKILRRLFRGLAVAQESSEQVSPVLARDQVDVADQFGAALAPLQHDLAAVKRLQFDP